MRDLLRSFFKPHSLVVFDTSLSRERLIQNGRITFIDDETPLLIEELRKEGFSVDHDTTGNNLRNIDNQIYDVAILDYHGVGQDLGTSQGLDLMRHIRRVSPRTRIIAYTSRSLSAAEAEFFRLSHAVLPKDLGLIDSFKIVETELQKAFSKEHLFDALIAKLNVADPKIKDQIHHTLAKTLASRDENKFKNIIEKIAGKAGEIAVATIVDRIFGI